MNASPSANAINANGESVGILAAVAAAKVAVLEVPVASFVPLPSASKKIEAWLAIDVPAMALTRASIVMVTLPPAGIEPFQWTRLLRMSAVAVPEVAVAPVRMTDGGS